jgi:hypothetical protein
MLKHRKTLERRDDWWKVFLWCGIGVAYFDLMTYPLAALGIPLILYFLLTDHSLLSNIGRMIHYSIDWVVGYAGMWVLKWLIGSAFTGYDLISDGLGAVGLRSSGALENVNMDYVHVLSENLTAMLTKPVLALAVLLVLALIIGLFRKQFAWKIQWSRLFPILLIGSYPFLWYYVIRNHSIVHVWFAYRVLAITGAAVTGILFCLVTEMRRPHES